MIDRKTLILKSSQSLAALAKGVAKLNVNSTCFYTFHQPEIPESAKRLKKIK